MASTHDVLTDKLESVRTAKTQLANSEMELTGNLEDDFESWEGVYVAASNLTEAATDLEEAVRARMSAAARAAEAEVESHLDDLTGQGRR